MDNNKKDTRQFNPGFKLWVSDNRNRGVFGKGKYQILEAIRRHGSLSKAAEAINISYRKAWGDICNAEKRIGRSLVIRKRGGAEGGHSELTPFAEKLLDLYGTFTEDTASFIENKFREKLLPYLEQDRPNEV